jgi:hypothetical protein
MGHFLRNEPKVCARALPSAGSGVGSADNRDLGRRRFDDIALAQGTNDDIGEFVGGLEARPINMTVL